jgi:hypothetical protein
VSIQKAVYRIGTGISSKDLINPKSFIEKFGLYLISLIVAEGGPFSVHRRI